ncbi:MAG: alpha/beta fold hydrolase [Anaerolineae bacterium]
MTVSWFEGDVLTNGIRMHFCRTGCSTLPRLVLLHGSSDNGMCWISAANALQQDYDVIMPDARGHGLSEAPDTGYESDIMAADFAGLIQTLALAPVYLMGHSMGAATAAVCAAANPELVSALVLCDPPWWAEDPPPPTEAQVADRVNRVAEMRALSKEELRSLARREHPDWPEIELGPWADSKQQHSPLHMRAPRWPRPSFRALVPQIQCPVLLITADPERGALVTPEVAAEAAGLWKEGRVVRISGAGHNIRRERFGPYMEAVRGFLSEMDQR